MILTVRDDVKRYRIECPDNAETRWGDGSTDFLIITGPGDPAVRYWLFDDILIEAARCGAFGLRLVSEVPLW